MVSTPRILSARRNMEASAIGLNSARTLARPRVRKPPPLIHLLFDAAERTLDDFGAGDQNLGPRFKASGHLMERRLVL